jgi:chemotaxis protein histidine kinase CheA
MAQVSVGQVENLEDLLRGLLSVREALESACREQIAVADSKYEEAREESLNSKNMLEIANQQEQAAQQAVQDTQELLESSRSALSAANSALSGCEAQSDDKNGAPPDCSSEESDVADAEDAVEQAQVELVQTQAELELAKENHQAMEQRVECAKQVLVMAVQAMEQSRAECAARFAAVSQSVDVATARLTAAQQALSAYLGTNASAAQFHSWLNWNPAQHGVPITPDTLRDRMNLSAEQRVLLQEYLYDRNPAYRGLVDKYRGEWAAAKGDAERNIVARKTRIHLCGEFGEQIARHALAPLGGRIETQGRTFVGDNGRYTKTDLLVTDLRVPVILGRGEGMGAPVGGSMAFEVKCGKADYLFSQRDHMVFQAEGHKQADAQCTLCSRDIHDLPPEKEKVLRDTLREAGSPLVGMLPRKNETDQSCLDFIRHDKEEKI